MVGKSPAARDEAHGVLTTRCGTGDATEETAEAKREERGEGEGDFLGGFGLVRPGGGPEEEAMPGAKAQQARERDVSVCYEKEIARGRGGEEEDTQERKR